MKRIPKSMLLAVGLALALILILWRTVAIGDALIDYWSIRRASARWQESRKALVAGDPSNSKEQAAPVPDGKPASASDSKEKDQPFAELRAGGLFGPPAPQAPVILSAILGDVSIINSQEARVGDTVADGSKVVEIQSNKVVIEKEGQRRDLVLFNIPPG